MTATKAGSKFLRIVLGLVGGLPMLAVAIAMLMIWIDPLSIDGGRMLKPATGLMMLEFLLLHSGAFMAAGPMAFDQRKTQVIWVGGFLVLYSLFIVGVAHMMDSRWVLWGLAGIMGSRLFALLIVPDKRAIMLLMSRSAGGMVILLLTCFLLIFWPWPELGITSGIRYDYFGQADGMMSEHPQRMLAWGIAYFTLMALVEFGIAWHWPGQTRAEAERAWREMKMRDAAMNRG